MNLILEKKKGKVVWGEVRWVTHVYRFPTMDAHIVYCKRTCTDQNLKYNR